MIDQALAASPRLRIRNEGAILVEKREEITDGDDQVVYTWSKPTDKMKREDTEDGDDQVVYTWSKPSEKSKRENSDDGDDQVVYTWSKPAGDA